MIRREGGLAPKLPGVSVTLLGEEAVCVNKPPTDTPAVEHVAGVVRVLGLRQPLERFDDFPVSGVASARALGAVVVDDVLNELLRVLGEPRVMAPELWKRWVTAVRNAISEIARAASTVTGASYLLRHSLLYGDPNTTIAVTPTPAFWDDTDRALARDGTLREWASGVIGFHRRG